MSHTRGTFLALALLSAAACTSPPQQPGTVTGYVYVVLATGEQVTNASRQVHLLDDTPALDSALMQVCVGLQREVAALRSVASTAPERVRELRDSASNRAWEARTRTLQARSLRSVPIDGEAQYVLDSVASGRYRLWADAVVQEERWSWLHPINVRGGDTLTLNLSNANADEDPFRCQMGRDGDDG